MSDELQFVAVLVPEDVSMSSATKSNDNLSKTDGVANQLPTFHSHRGLSPVLVSSAKIRNRLKRFPMDQVRFCEHRAEATV